MLPSRRLLGRAGGLAVVGWLSLGIPLSSASPPPLGKDEVRCSDDSCSLGACQSLALLNDPAQALAPLRVIPQVEGGAAVGFKLFGITASSLAVRFGLQNGDVLTKLNDHSLAGPEAAMQAFSAARNEPVIRIGLLRAGQPIERRLILDVRAVTASECPAPRKPTAASVASDAPAASEPSSWARDIQCRGTRCVLKNGALDRILADQDQLMRGVRIVPMLVGGQQRGFKLFAIRPGSAYAALGLQNGDVVETIAGLPLNSAESALSAYSQVRSQASIPVEIRRRGTALTLTYDIERPRPGRSR